MIRNLVSSVILAMVFSFSAAANAAECGQASWYQLRGLTASGQQADPEALTAAHPTLAFGTEVIVTNLENGRSVNLTIVDRGPFVKGRIIDVSRRAARDLGFMTQGLTRVRVVPAEHDQADAKACE